MTTNGSRELFFSTFTGLQKHYISVLHRPDVDVPLDVQVVKVVSILHLAKVWALQPLYDLSLHHSSDVSR